MRIIGLVGTKGAGKDTFADALGLPKYSFAAPIKEACCAIFMLDDEAFEDRRLKETVDPRWGISPRSMLQTLGTECVRGHFGDNHWIRHMSMRLDQCDEDEVVITDVRFRDEADFVRERGGELIQIVRPAHATVDAHSSETAIYNIPCDTIVLNNGTKEQLCKQATSFRKKNMSSM
ncbi:Deoxynucleotide monophosphate kinase [Tribonema minus]|uniref:Deoxynucleotide monophosphate kinase n=1 Tax=Tribonema minus TaxID=303371 RepID=A0A836CHH3_9STRA|nr:Deoxynucleotide monophosphate kinase [Tribonema minus]